MSAADRTFTAGFNLQFRQEQHHHLIYLRQLHCQTLQFTPFVWIVMGITIRHRNNQMAVL